MVASWKRDCLTSSGPAYNHSAVAKMAQAAKEGDKCPLCGEGELVVSTSGKNLVCPKCGRIVTLIGKQMP